MASPIHEESFMINTAQVKQVATKFSRPSRRAMTVGGSSALIALAIYGIYKNPPMHTVEPGSFTVRVNKFTGATLAATDGVMLAVPGVHRISHVDLREQSYRPAVAGNQSSFQSTEGLSFGLEVAVRYSINGKALEANLQNLPADIHKERVQPTIDSVIYRSLARYTMREIFSSKRAEVEKMIVDDLTKALAADAATLKAVQMGKITLPPDYQRGMESLLAEELATEKMRFTLELKAKRVKETELESEGERVRREKLAQAAAGEQIIAAKAQEEAMKHVIPFKEKQIAQRQLEAEAIKQSTIRQAEGSAQARRIEAAGEADSRQKLADAEAYRQDKIGRVASEQMSREGSILTRHPLLVQKAMVDKLSDKVNVIIAPSGTDGRFLGAAIAGDYSREARNEQVGLHKGGNGNGRSSNRDDSKETDPELDAQLDNAVAARN
jgi:regulator of protease activity HflC (stomatin/prohibitin superfamily)